MEFSILYAIQSMHSPVMDKLMLGITAVAGEYGHLWLILAAVLLFFPKTRKAGAAILVSYILVLVAGQLILKDLIARPRPCQLDETVALLVARPASYSCPSTHSAWAFAAATALFCSFRKPGIVAMVVAALIAFSRMYLFVHFPTDVLFGIVLGIALGIAAVKLVAIAAEKLAAKKKA